MRPASCWSAQRSAIRTAHWKMRHFVGPPARAFSSTRAYIFSYRRGTDIAIVGRTSCSAAGTSSIDGT